jgi:hypothetical protein
MKKVYQITLTADDAMAILWVLGAGTAAMAQQGASGISGFQAAVDRFLVQVGGVAYHRPSQAVLEEIKALREEVREELSRDQKQ